MCCKSKFLNKESFLENLKKSRQVDIKRGFTATGVHRDDFMIYINGRPVSIFGSQGQQRTAALSLKLAEVEIIKSQTEESPILILDDVLSELDQSRRKKLLKFCSICQTFISSTDFDESFDNAKIIKISNGQPN